MPDRRLLPAGRDDQGALGGHLRRRAPSRTRSPRSSRDLRAAAPDARASSARWPRPAPPRRHRARASRCSSVEPVRARRGADAALRPRASTEPLGPRGLHDRADGADPHRPGAAQPTTPRRARALVELFGAPERWARDDARASCGRRSSALVPSFTGATTFTLAGAVHLRPRGRGGQVLLLAARRRGAAGASTSTARSSTAATTASCRSCSIPWTLLGATGACRSRRGSAMMDALLPRRRLGPAARRHARRARARRKAERGLPSFDACVAELLEEADVDPALEELARHAALRGLRALPLHAGRDEERDADAVRDRLPAGLRAGAARRTFDQLRMQCIAHGRRRRGADRRGALPAGRGERHQAVPRRLEAPRTHARRARGRAARRALRAGGLHGRVRLSADDLGDGRWRVMLCVHNTTRGGRGPRPRRGAARSACSPRTSSLRLDGGRFALAARRPSGVRASVNTFPVLATDGRRRGARRGDHAARPPAARAREPRRPVRRHRDRGGAAAARARALATTSATAIAAADPAVREMVERAAAATPEDIIALHGRIDAVRSGAAARRAAAARREVDGRRRHLPPRRQGRAAPRATARDALRPDARRPHARRIERIYVDYDDSVHLGVTVDDDPGQELMRETGRYLFFIPDEVEVCPT